MTQTHFLIDASGQEWTALSLHQRMLKEKNDQIERLQREIDGLAILVEACSGGVYRRVSPPAR